MTLSMPLLENWKCLIIDAENIIDRDVDLLPVRDRVPLARAIVRIRLRLEVPHDLVAPLAPDLVRHLTVAGPIRHLLATRGLIPIVLIRNVPGRGHGLARGPGRAPSLLNTLHKFVASHGHCLLHVVFRVGAHQFRLHQLFLVEGL